jgi:hypothetical protein
MAKKPRPRTQRRGAERASSKLQSARERLFRLEPGGAAERPLPIRSAAVVEVLAQSVSCPLCSGRHEVVEHVAVTIAGRRLREARLRCRQCGSRRSLWFGIDEPRLN